jgi:hypothetical protein
MINTVNTYTGVFLIAFIADQNQYIFSPQNEVLGNLIQMYNRNGIEKIMRYNKAKCKFEKLSKADVKLFFDWDTHSILQLEKAKFIK